jgi:hypothetical protein
VSSSTENGKYEINIYWNAQLAARGPITETTGIRKSKKEQTQGQNKLRDCSIHYGNFNLKGSVSIV